MVLGKNYAEIAQLVEHDLAKVGVASSSLVFRSNQGPIRSLPFFYLTRNLIKVEIAPPSLKLRRRSPDGGIGRHAGLKILWPVMAVRVQFPLRVQKIP